jgi:hypothetical protein
MVSVRSMVVIQLVNHRTERHDTNRTPGSLHIDRKPAHPGGGCEGMG